ncbi:MAG: hypothetical protein ABIA66_02755 [Candidatus Omnitrophota bacterium]
MNLREKIEKRVNKLMEQEEVTIVPGDTVEVDGDDLEVVAVGDELVIVKDDAGEEESVDKSDIEMVQGTPVEVETKETLVASEPSPLPITHGEEVEEGRKAKLIDKIQVKRVPNQEIFYGWKKTKKAKKFKKVKK